MENLNLIGGLLDGEKSKELLSKFSTLILPEISKLIGKDKYVILRVTNKGDVVYLIVDKTKLSEDISIDPDAIIETGQVKDFVNKINKFI